MAKLNTDLVRRGSLVNMVSTEVQCYSCGKTGHVKQDWRYRKNVEIVAKKYNNLVNQCRAKGKFQGRSDDIRNNAGGRPK